MYTHALVGWRFRLQLLDAETADPSLVRQLLRALVTHSVTAVDADASRVQQPDELLATSRALLRRVVMATGSSAAYHSAQPQLPHITLDLTATSTRAPT